MRHHREQLSATSFLSLLVWTGWLLAGAAALFSIASAGRSGRGG